MNELDNLTLDGFDLGAALGIPEQEKAAPATLPDQGGIKVSHRMGARQLWRKAASEKALEDAIDWHFREGDCYHCFSSGDVDSFSFFKMVLRQQHIKYAAISTWCMAGEDVKDLRKWHERGMIDRVDFQRELSGCLRRRSGFHSSLRRSAGDLPQPLQSDGYRGGTVRLPHRIQRQCEHQSTE